MVHPHIIAIHTSLLALELVYKKKDFVLSAFLSIDQPIYNVYIYSLATFYAPSILV